jgi:hypothetical protein
MLLLGAVFALLLAGFWLYCLADVVLTPSNECHRLPKAAWIAIVAGTFVIGAVVWLAVRRPAQPTVASLPPGPSPDPGGTSGGTRRAGGAGQDSARPQEQRELGRPGNDPGRESGPADESGPDRAPGPAQMFTGRESVSRASPNIPISPTGAASLISPVGPDDDPVFLRSLDRTIHGAEAGDDPAAG